MNPIRIYLPVALACVAVAAILGYLALRPPAPPKPAGPPEKVTIAYSATTDSVLPIVAQVMGYYQEEGLQVVPQLHPYGKLALNQLLEGKADFATVAETPFMLAVMNGAQISVLATIQTTGRNHAIIARRDRGISSPGDLKGRKIGVTLGTTADFFMDTFLAVHEIARKDMKVVGLNPGAQAGALARGEVDAVAAFKPFSLQVQKTLGERGTVFFDENIYTFMFNVVATQKFISENPEKVRKLLRALIKAEGYVERHQAEAQQAVADFCKMEPELVREIWPDFSYGVKLDQSLVLALEEETRWAIKEGLVGTRNMPDYLDYIYLGALERIRPKTVRILR
jgi:ABC-type nitrate/sulfonate/bicarbonate transport system substrate-binding protein